MKIVLAEKVSPATLAVFQAEPGWNVVTHDQIKDGLANELKDADGLVVSNFRREIRVPWRDIVEVSGSRWVSTRQVTITLDRDLGFGTSIIFMPKTRILWPGQEHPAAQELRDLIRENISPI